ncbi:hypothetical protein ACR6HW_04425 [Fusibacter sp. JL298sf-3]
MLTHAHGRKPIFEPRTGWAYSNIGYYHVRCILETVYGMSIDWYSVSVFFALWV